MANFDVHWRFLWRRIGCQIKALRLLYTFLINFINANGKFNYASGANIITIVRDGTRKLAILLSYNIKHLLEENTVCPRRPSLQIGELLLLAWTEQESHVCNVNQADSTTWSHFFSVTLSFSYPFQMSLYYYY